MGRFVQLRQRAIQGRLINTSLLQALVAVQPMFNYKADTSQKVSSEPPSFQVEGTPTELSHERTLRPKVEDRLKNLFLNRLSNSRTASQGPSEREKDQGYSAVLCMPANPLVDKESRPVYVKNTLNGLFNGQIGPIDRAPEEGRVDTADRSIIQEPVALGHPHKNDISGTVRPEDRRIPQGRSPDSCSQEEIIRISPQGMSQLCGAHHFTIDGNPRFENIGVKHEYNYTNKSGAYDIILLKEFVLFRAFYNSSAQDPTRRVHPGTRQRVLKCIRDWIDTPSMKERIFWLHGPAGVGKSAIAQTIARSCTREQLAATFFFYRSDPGRNDGNRLFTTLAWQLAYSIPATKQALVHSLIECPDIPTRDVETQFDELIVKPFMALKKLGGKLLAPIVIIDGVDECSDDNLQRRFLSMIGNAVKDDRISLRFLICSRPEAHIQDTINVFRSVTLPLDLAELDDANQDIEKYLKAEFSRIASEHGLDPSWPGDEIIREFVYKACGQFVYASTVIKYVGDEYNSAETQLDIIRGLRPLSSISPFAELDELYKEILRRQRDPVFVGDFLSLLIGRYWIQHDGLYNDDALLMNVSEKELHRKLRGMRSILKFEPYIDVHHRSFLDFLQDPSRSGQYHVSKQAGARRYLDFVVDSLVCSVSTVIERHDDHFRPEFSYIFFVYPPKLVLPIEEWQKALQPLLEIQHKLLMLPNFRSIWEFLPCKRCTGLHTMRNLLLHLTFILGASGCISRSALMTESSADRFEPVPNSLIHLNFTETQIKVLENDLDGCLLSLIARLQQRILGGAPDPVTIQLFGSLLRFDPVETGMRVRSMSNAQHLMDLIDESINNNHNCSDYGPDIPCKAVQLALEIFARVPVLPRSLFLEATVGPHQEDAMSVPRKYVVETELFFQTGFLSKILHSSYVVRTLWVYEDQQFLSTSDKIKEDNELLSEWRKRSRPGYGTQIRVMLEVAKAIQYFHSMGVVLHDDTDSDDILLDPELHARFRFLGLMARSVNVTPSSFLTQQLFSREDNVFLFGCLFYEMCFGTRISYDDRHFRDKESALAILVKRPSKPEIGDNVWQLIQRCCAKDPENRLSMDDVVKEIEGWDIN